MGLSTIKVGTTFYFDYSTRNISGMSQDADATPIFWVFKNAETTGVITTLHGASLSFRGVYPGAYYGTITASSGNGFAPNNYYNIMVSGRVNGITTFNNVHTLYAEQYSFDSYSIAASAVYYADIHHDIDDVNNQDEYTVIWYKNDAPVTGYPVPTLRVIKRSDNTNLIPATGMSAVGYVAVKYDETSAVRRTLDGEPYIVVATIDYDGATREWRKIIGNDVNTA
jgi:hypothetical protein